MAEADDGGWGTEHYGDGASGPWVAARCGQGHQAWHGVPSELFPGATAWRCLDCGEERVAHPPVSSCCQASLVMDATRTFCGQCGRCLHDLNGPDALDAHQYACPDCGGNGYAGGVDDLYCDTCEGEGLVDG